MTKKASDSKWAIAWILWLAAFLAVEIPAAIRKAKLDTLSEHVSKIWFPLVWQRCVLAVFMLTLTSHFVLEWPGGSAIIATGLPVGSIIAYRMTKRWVE